MDKLQIKVYNSLDLVEIEYKINGNTNTTLGYVIEHNPEEKIKITNIKPRTRIATTRERVLEFYSSDVSIRPLTRKEQIQECEFGLRIEIQSPLDKGYLPIGRYTYNRESGLTVAGYMLKVARSRGNKCLVMSNTLPLNQKEELLEMTKRTQGRACELRFPLSKVCITKLE